MGMSRPGYAMLCCVVLFLGVGDLAFGLIVLSNLNLPVCLFFFWWFHSFGDRGMNILSRARWDVALACVVGIIRVSFFFPPFLVGRGKAEQSKK